MKRSLKFTAALGAVALVAGLAGCTPAKGGSDVLTMWTFKQSEVPALEAAGAAWTKTSGVTLKVSVYTPDDAYKTKLQAAAKSGKLPDIVTVHSQGDDWSLAQAGIVADLSKDFDDKWKSQFLPGVVDASQITQDTIDNSGDDPSTTKKDLKAGATYSIPYLAGTPGVIFANKTLLKAAGVDTANAPKTWEAWVTAIGATTKKDSSTGGLVTGLQVPETGYFWLYRPLAYAYLGKDAFYGRQGIDQKPSWDSADSVETLKLYDQLSNLWTPGVLALGIDQADQAFASGKAAWDVGGTFTLGSLATFGLAAKDIMVFPVPASTHGKEGSISYQASPLLGASVTSASKHKKDAVSFIKFLTSVDGAKIFAGKALDLPATSIPASELGDPLLQQLVGLATPAAGSVAFNPNDFSADPAGTIGHDSAVLLTNLVAKTDTVDGVAKNLSAAYKAAWAAIK